MSLRLRESPNASLELLVLRLGFLQDGDVGVGVFPEGEEASLWQAHAFQ